MSRIYYSEQGAWIGQSWWTESKEHMTTATRAVGRLGQGGRVWRVGVGTQHTHLMYTLNLNDLLPSHFSSLLAKLFTGYWAGMEIRSQIGQRLGTKYPQQMPFSFQMRMLLAPFSWHWPTTLLGHYTSSNMDSGLERWNGLKARALRALHGSMNRTMCMSPWRACVCCCPWPPNTDRMYSLSFGWTATFLTRLMIFRWHNS